VTALCALIQGQIRSVTPLAMETQAVSIFSHVASVVADQPLLLSMLWVATPCANLVRATARSFQTVASVYQVKPNSCSTTAMEFYPRLKLSTNIQGHSRIVQHSLNMACNQFEKRVGHTLLDSDTRKPLCLSPVWHVERLYRHLFAPTTQPVVHMPSPISHYLHPISSNRRVLPD
jgi:hypothetical protein